jgi:hypothetical protein
MPDMMVLFACLSQCLDRTTLRQLVRVSDALWSITGCVTRRGLARWAGQGGRSRTIPRFFPTRLRWSKVPWALMRHPL